MANLLSQNEVDVLMKAISSGALPAAETAAAPAKAAPAASAANVKLYDFKHPVLFLKDQLRTLQMIHETFARNLANTVSSSLRTTVTMKCVGVDQISYGEFIMSLPDPCTIVSVRLHPSEGRMLMAIHPAVGMGIVDRVMGGQGISESVARPFTEIEQALLDEMIATALRDLESAWNRIMKISFSAESVEYSAQFAQVTTEEDTVVATTMEVTFSETHGMMSLCYPFRALNPMIERLNAKHWIEEEQKAQAAKSRDNIQACIVQIPVEVQGHLGSTTISMKELMQIRKGDVLLLDRGVTQAVDLKVGGKVRFCGNLGTFHGKTAVLVESRAEL